jgi:hypothetical protein
MMHIDGDPVRMGKEISVKIIPLGLKVLVPVKVPKRNPISPRQILMRIADTFS